MTSRRISIISCSTLLLISGALYFSAYSTATLTPTGPGTYNLAILGITVPYTDSIRTSLAFVFSPLRRTAAGTTTITGTVVIPVYPQKREIMLRKIDGTLIGLLVPSSLESTTSTLKDGDQVKITYGETPDKESLFVRRFLIKSLAVVTLNKES